jgi:hypothetical protein
MPPQLSRRPRLGSRPFPHRSGRRRRPGNCRPLVEELEPRLTPDATAFGVNVPITSDPGVQQMPSVAVDPHDARHLVVAYMDYSLLHTGYAGIGVAVSQDAGAGWRRTSIPLPAGFDGGAANPVVHFDDHGHVFVSFMAQGNCTTIPRKKQLSQAGPQDLEEVIVVPACLLPLARHAGLLGPFVL